VKPSVIIVRNAKDPTKAKVVRSVFACDRPSFLFPVAGALTVGPAVPEGLISVGDGCCRPLENDGNGGEGCGKGMESAMNDNEKYSSSWCDEWTYALQFLDASDTQVCHVVSDEE
jgi:hypothetical protein